MTEYIVASTVRSLAEVCLDHISDRNCRIDGSLVDGTPRTQLE
jgi:hypothetical protein